MNGIQSSLGLFSVALINLSMCLPRSLGLISVRSTEVSLNAIHSSLGIFIVALIDNSMCLHRSLGLFSVSDRR